MDVCCLNRPFDDQTQERVHIESEAVMEILSMVQGKKWTMISSDFIDWEIDRIPEDERRRKVLHLQSLSDARVSKDENLESRQAILEKMGFQPLDAFHIAAAEKAEADVILTTDDSLIKGYKRHKNLIKTRIENPLQFLMEVNMP